MRKLLISILLILLIIMAALFVTNGINIGPLQVLGVSQIQAANDELTKQINEAKAANENYEGKLSQLQKDISELTQSKEECLNRINASTESQIQDATQTKNYTIEYLWSAVGNHATKNGVTIKMDVTTGSIANSEYKNLSFTVTGNYLSITNFITDIENDSTLEFTIDNFSMEKEKCTFTVKDVKIQQEKTTVPNNANSSTNSNTSNTTSNTTTNTTTNTTNNTTTD